MKSLYLLLNPDLCEASFQPTFHQGTRVFVQMSWERQEMRVGAQQNPNDVHFCLSVALLPISRSGHSRQSARHSKLVGRGTIYFSQMTQIAEGTAHCIETPYYTMKAWPVTPDLRFTLLSVNYNTSARPTSECASASGCWRCVNFRAFEHIEHCAI